MRNGGESDHYARWIAERPVISTEAAAELARSGQEFVGLSFSSCVKDIADGKFPYRSVAFIRSGIKAETPEELEGVLDEYTKYYWYEKPKKCRKIAERLIREGKLDQPALRGEPRPFIGLEHWLPSGKMREYNRWQKKARNKVLYKAIQLIQEGPQSGAFLRCHINKPHLFYLPFNINQAHKGTYSILLLSISFVPKRFLVNIVPCFSLNSFKPSTKPSDSRS